MSTPRTSSMPGPRFGIFVSILSFVALVVLLTGAMITALNYFQTRRAASQVAIAALRNLPQAR